VDPALVALLFPLTVCQCQYIVSSRNQKPESDYCKRAIYSQIFVKSLRHNLFCGEQNILDLIYSKYPDMISDDLSIHYEKIVVC